MCPGNLNRRVRCLLTRCLIAAALVVPTAAHAERTLEVAFEPTGDPQIAVWLETADGQFVDTLMVTRLVATFGLGNRPGRADFGGGYLWPYGRREMTLPVWAHRRGVEYDRLVFQDCKESWLGWHEIHSSDEPFYCRPVTPSEMAVDTITCPTVNFRTDKGIPVERVNSSRNPVCATVARDNPPKTFYPPRNDLSGRDLARDWSGVDGYNAINDLDAVSQATPRASELHRLTYQTPAGMADGDYVIWVEVNQEYDGNGHHNYPFYTDPMLPDYGLTSIGQPSVIWKVPVTIADGHATEYATSYSGYGSATGSDGDVRAPDMSITTGVEGSGAGRLVFQGDAAQQYQVRVIYTPDAVCAKPPPVTGLKATRVEWGEIELQFVDTSTESAQVTRYEVRYAQHKIDSVADLSDSVPGPTVLPNAPGETKTLLIDRLQQSTEYTIAVRTFNSCQQASPLQTVTVTTATREFKTVDACFIATAAYGSLDESQVVTLRKFRDEALLTNPIGRKFVSLYYFISPSIADYIRDDEDRKAAVRTALDPVVRIVRAFE